MKKILFVQDRHYQTIDRLRERAANHQIVSSVFRNEADLMKLIQKEHPHLVLYLNPTLPSSYLTSQIVNIKKDTVHVALITSSEQRHINDQFDCYLCSETGCKGPRCFFSKLPDLLIREPKSSIPFFRKRRERRLIEEFESALEKIDRPAQRPLRSFNDLLSDQKRADYLSVIEELFLLAPKMMARKIPRANVQQAFVFDTVRLFAQPHSKILCVGSHEDTAAEALTRLGFWVESIDPVKNYDLNTFFHLSSTPKEAYDIIFSTSVVEHVENDELFFTQIEQLLKREGRFIFTCDFKNDYKKGDPLFSCNYRFYTNEDLHKRVLPLLKTLRPVDHPNWDQSCHDFQHDGIDYSFATVTLEKA
jgi:hypothetical protein